MWIISFCQVYFSIWLLWVSFMLEPYLKCLVFLVLLFINNKGVRARLIWKLWWPVGMLTCCLHVRTTEQSTEHWLGDPQKFVRGVSLLAVQSLWEDIVDFVPKAWLLGFIRSKGSSLEVCGTTYSADFEPICVFSESWPAAMLNTSRLWKQVDPLCRHPPSPYGFKFFHSAESTSSHPFTVLLPK